MSKKISYNLAKTASTRRNNGAAQGTLVKVKQGNVFCYFDNPDYPTTEIRMFMSQSKFYVEYYTFQKSSYGRFFRSLCGKTTVSKQLFLELQKLYDQDSYNSKNIELPMSYEALVESDASTFDIPFMQTPESTFIEKECQSEIKKFKKSLSTTDRAAFVSFEEGLSERAFANKQKCSPSAAHYKKDKIQKKFADFAKTTI